ncbi:MAG: shikimate kinase [bacterium]|nr:shikimate kinase [bacterium]
MGIPLEKGGEVLTPKVWLIGMMSSGKTKVGRMLSHRSGLPFVDVDDEIVERAGMTIPQIFAQHGEPAFRAMECAEVERIAADSQRLVVATGGGAILDPDSRRVMRKTGLVVWLKPSIASLIAKRKTANRPLLQGHSDLAARYTEIWKARRHLYEEAAHLSVDMDHKSRELVAEEVWRLWNAS